jgi:hypothetical protein
MSELKPVYILQVLLQFHTYHSSENQPANNVSYNICICVFDMLPRASAMSYQLLSAKHRAVAAYFYNFKYRKMLHIFT